MGLANFNNRTLFQGDNLEFLRGMNSETVDLIATDPPFNKGKDFHATPDSLAAGASFPDRWRWEQDVQPAWENGIKRDWPEAWAVIEAAKVASGMDMAAFLCWLGVRVMECHRILKPTGSFYLHIDQTAQAWVKCLLDAIFERNNFRNEIVWSYTGNSEPRNCFPKKHDTLLFYGKTAEGVFNRVAMPYSEATLRRYNHVDEDGRRYKMSSLRNGLEKVYMKEDGKAAPDVWDDIPVPRTKAERTGYPTQKPLALYERIIKASSNPGDMVLDPFCGCATTPVAAETLGREWIGMDLWTGCPDIVKKRLQDAQQLWAAGQVAVITTPPARTDNGETAAPYMEQVKTRRRRPAMTREQMRAVLLEKWGVICWGCGFVPPGKDARHFDLDHNLPKAGGGHDDLDNRAILCRPCNGKKSNTMTLDGLRRWNKRNGYWYGKPPIDQRIPLREAVEWARDYLADRAEQGRLVTTA